MILKSKIPPKIDLCISKFYYVSFLLSKHNLNLWADKASSCQVVDFLHSPEEIKE